MPRPRSLVFFSLHQGEEGAARLWMSWAGDTFHLPLSPLVSTRGFFSGTPFPAVLAGRGAARFPLAPPSILPQALCLPGPSCRR
jgi:hypothetical protein